MELIASLGFLFDCKKYDPVVVLCFFSFDFLYDNLNVWLSFVKYLSSQKQPKSVVVGDRIFECALPFIFKFMVLYSMVNIRFVGPLWVDIDVLKA